MKAETDKAISLWPHSLEVVEQEADAVCNRYLFCQIRTPPSHLSWDPASFPAPSACWGKLGDPIEREREKKMSASVSSHRCRDDYCGFRDCWMSPDLRLRFRGGLFRLLDEHVCITEESHPSARNSDSFHARVVKQRAPATWTHVNSLLTKSEPHVGHSLGRGHTLR